MIKAKRKIIFISILICKLAISAADSETATQEFSLKNGLKVLIKEDHRAPIVVSQIWYRVGSSYEELGQTGISHLLEHLMFKGTTKYPPGELSRIIAAQGGSENAFTGRDYTAYLQSLEKSRLAISFELESDRMRNLLLDPEEFAKELKVVMEERRLRTDDDPQALTQEQLFATALVNSPYRWGVIGWMEDLENQNVAAVRAWYRRWYAPENAALVVAGDVNPQEVRELAERYFASIPNGEGLPPPRVLKEPRQLGERRLTVKAPARLPYLVMGYHVPVLRDGTDAAEIYALEVLAQVLSGDDSSRFARELVRGTEVAAGVSAEYSMYSRLPELFTLGGTPASGKDIATLEKSLRVQIERVRTDPVSAAELARVKTRAVADNIYERDSVFYQAMQIGLLETVGLNWRIAEEYVERVRAVTPEQIQAAAIKYLRDDQLTVAILDPQSLSGEKAQSEFESIKENKSTVR